MSSASSGTRGKSVPAGNARRASALSAGGSAVSGESAPAGSETGGSAVDPVLRVREAVFAVRFWGLSAGTGRGRPRLSSLRLMF